MNSPHLARIERLDEVIRFLRVTKKQLIEPTGFSYASVAGKTKFPSDKIAKAICAHWRISYDWLLRGVGDMVIEESKPLPIERSLIISEAPQQKGAPVVIDIKPESLNGRKILVDFTEYPDVFFNLLKTAKEMIRTPEQQILWVISNFVKETEGSTQQ